jgi:hypothetical protein
MTPIQEAGDWKGRPIWVTIEFRKLLRGYHVTEKPKRPRQPGPSLYSCLHRRQLSLLQQALTQLGGGVPHWVFKKAAEVARHEPLS